MLVQAAASLTLPRCFAQSSGPVSAGPVDTVRARKGEDFSVRLPVHVRSGYHVNSNAPKDEYLIPLKLSWSASPFAAGKVLYPQPKLEKAAFSPQPISVFTGDFEIVSNLKAPRTLPNGMTTLSGKLRYQACTDKECLQPRVIEVHVPVDLH